MTALPSSRNHLVLLLILVASLAQRAWYAAEVWTTQLITVPYLDTADYDRWARALVAGDWGVGEPYWLGPLYPHLLALSYAVFGVGGPEILIGQWLLTVFNVWLVHRLARHWLDDRWALVAAALYAGYGPPVFYAGLKLMVTVTTTLLLLVVWQAQQASERPGRARWLGLGLLVGLTALARGNVLVLLVLLPLLLWRRPDLGRPQAWRLIGWLWLGAAVVIAPVTLRNALVGKDLVLLTSNAGVNLYIGQQVEYDGRFGAMSDASGFEFDPTGRTLLEAELGRGLRPSEISRELAGRAVRRIVDEPGAMVAHYARKAYRFWSGYELPQIYSWNFWRERRISLRAVPVPALVLLSAGLVGAWTLDRRARRLWLIVVGGWFASLLPFFPTARYRLPIMGLLAIAAAAWLAALVASIRARRVRRAGALLTAAAILVVALWPTWSRYDPAEEAWNCHLNRARRAAEVGDAATLRAACAEAERLRPGLAETPYRQGAFLQRLGDREGALAAFREAARREPGSAFANYHVGATLAALGRRREALLWYERAAAADSTWALPHQGRAEALRAEGALADAAAAMRRAVALEPGRARYRGNLASLLAGAGRQDEALAILRELVRDFPGYAPGWFNLALAELQAGNETAARQALERAAARPDLEPSQRAQIDALRGRLR